MHIYTRMQIPVTPMTGSKPSPMSWVRGPVLGRGTFAIVTLAFVPSHNKLIAVKTSPLSHSLTLRWEQSVLSDLPPCPHIIACFGGGEDDAESYNVFLEYVPGGSLADFLRARGPLPEPAARRHARSILAGMRHMHSNGYVHCDLKPSNVLVVDGTGDVRIADFGLAKSRLRGVRDDDREPRFSVRGTPMYLAPECVIGNEYDAPMDVWSLGCIVLEMVTGRPPWECGGVEELILRVGTAECCPSIPEELSEEGKDFLRRCFVRDPARRWTAEMLLDHPFAAEEGAIVECASSRNDSPRTVLNFDGWVQEDRMSGSVFATDSSAAARIGELATGKAVGWEESWGEGRWITLRGS